MTILYQYPPTPAQAAPVGGATEAEQQIQSGLLQQIADNTDPGTAAGLAKETKQDTQITLATALNAKDFATQATLASLLAKFGSLGQKASAGSAPVVLSTEQEAKIDLLAKDSTVAKDSSISAQSVLIGAVTETAPASDTASSGLNGRLQRIAQRITSLISLFPAAIGQQSRAASLSISWATEQEAQIGIVTETAPASDTASSGLNGRLQRIAQRITSLIAVFPASLGQKTMAASLAVTLASDQSSLPVVPQALTGSYQEILNLTNSAQTFTAPANAKWCKIMCDDTNTSKIRAKIGAVATTTSGMQFQPGRAEDYAIAGNISVITEDAVTNQKVYVQFGV